MLGPVDQDRVGVGDIQAIFNDGGGNQHIIFTFGEGKHGIFQRALSHLPMRHNNAGRGDEMLNAISQILETADFVIDHKDLAIAVNLALHRLAHQGFIKFGKHGMDGQALLGWRMNGAHVTDATEAHVQRTRNGRCAQGQDIHLGAQLFKLFFVAHPKALLFVNDQHAQVFEINIIAEQTMGPHHKVNAAFA